jgi:hypothetical protein
MDLDMNLHKSRENEDITKPYALLNEVLLRIKFVCAFKLQMFVRNCLFYHWLTSVYAALPETCDMFVSTIHSSLQLLQQGSVVGEIHAQMAVYVELNLQIGKSADHSGRTL